MTLHEIWMQLVAKEPRLSDPQTKVEFTSENLRKILAAVYIKGLQWGEGDRDNIFSDPPNPTQGMPQFMEDIFNGEAK